MQNKCEEGCIRSDILGSKLAPSLKKARHDDVADDEEDKNNGAADATLG